MMFDVGLNVEIVTNVEVGEPENLQGLLSPCIFGPRYSSTTVPSPGLCQLRCFDRVSETSEFAKACV